MKCDSCLWLIDKRICPFQRCVKIEGWKADKELDEKKLDDGTVIKKRRINSAFVE